MTTVSENWWLLSTFAFTFTHTSDLPVPDFSQTPEVLEPKHNKDFLSLRPMSTTNLTASIAELKLKELGPQELLARGSLPSQDTIFKRCLCRLSLYSTSDLKEILPNKPWISNRGKQTNKTIDDSILTNWCLVAGLSRKQLFKEQHDTADVVEELDSLFPGLLYILRFPAFDNTYKKNIPSELLQIRLKYWAYQPDVLRLGFTTFQAWIHVVVDQLAMKGIRLVAEGDIDTFWGTFKPNDYNNDPIEKVGTFTERWLNGGKPGGNQLSAQLLAVASAKPTDFTHVVKGINVVAKLCVVCKADLPAKSLIRTPGNTLCCKPCHDKLLEICHICTESTHKPLSTTIICGHKYCTDCLSHKFESSTKSVHDFPPQCCGQRLSIHSHHKILSNEITIRYLEHLEEQISRKAILCATAACEKQIIKHYCIEDEWGLCSKCLQRTCTRCEKLEDEHNTTDEQSSAEVDNKNDNKQDPSVKERKCPRTADDELLELAKSNKWRNCPKCNAMVSRSVGCNAMRCRCGQGFCYTCGERYEIERTCRCRVTYEHEQPGQPLRANRWRPQAARYLEPIAQPAGVEQDEDNQMLERVQQLVDDLTDGEDQAARDARDVSNARRMQRETERRHAAAGARGLPRRQPREAQQQVIREAQEAREAAWELLRRVAQEEPELPDPS